MGILDDAIREHLDLKRKHGAREAELQEIEDEAFGAGDQPDPFVAGELYQEVGSSEAADSGVSATESADSQLPSSEFADVGNEEPTRLVEPEALLPMEPPSAPAPETSDERIGAEPASQVPGQVELPGQDEIPGQERLDAEAEAAAAEEPESYQAPEPFSEELAEEPPSEELPEPPATSESLEELIAEEEPFPEDSAAPPPAPAPTETEREPESRPLEPEPSAEAPPEPEAAVPDPPPPPPEPGTEPAGRARGRVDVPTQEHPPPGDTGDLPPLPGEEPELRPDTSYELPPHPMEEQYSAEEPASADEPISGEEPLPAEEPAAGSDGPQLYDFETDEDSVPPPSGRSAVEDDFEALGPAEEEAPYLDEEEPYPEEESTAVRPAVEDEEDEDTSPKRKRRFEQEEGEEGLWFEKGPPKDFDFDD
jgi:hypothetical protein